jgi:hypothetical protein
VVIYVRVEKDGELSGSCCSSCCRPAKRLWGGAGDLRVVCSPVGGPSLVDIWTDRKRDYNYCMSCGTRVEQDASGVLPAWLAWEPVEEVIFVNTGTDG